MGKKRFLPAGIIKPTASDPHKRQKRSIKGKTLTYPNDPISVAGGYNNFVLFLACVSTETFVSSFLNIYILRQRPLGPVDSISPCTVGDGKI